MDNINIQHTQDQTTTNASVSPPPSSEPISVTKTDMNNSYVPNLSSEPELNSTTSMGLELLANPNKLDNSKEYSMSSQQIPVEYPSQNIIQENTEVGVVDKITLDPNIQSGGEVNTISDMSSPRSDLSLDLGFAGISQQQPPTENVMPQQNEPIDPDAPKPVHMMTGSEITQEKQDYLYKFKRLEQAGISPSENFNMNSDLNIMREEYSRLKKLRDLDSSIKFQKKMLMAAVTGIEFLNDKFDPFDVQLSGWGESVNEGLSDYDEVFEELHEKYKSKAKIAPELRLLFMLGGSAFMFHLQNTMFKSSIPGMGDIMKQNPDLMKQFAKAAMSSATNSGGDSGGGSMPGAMPGMFGGMGQQVPPSPQMRPEMRGPPVEEVLSGFNNPTNRDVDKDNMSDISSIAGDIYTDAQKQDTGPQTIDLKL